MSTIKKILVPTDFSACSAAAETAAADLARTTGAELVLLHVLNDIPFLLNDVPGYVPAEEIANAEEAAKVAMQQQAARMVQDGLPVSCRVVHGSAAQSIVTAADDSHANLIVMGTHGRRGFRHMLLGSVAERVARTTKIPAMMVPLQHP